VIVTGRLQRVSAMDVEQVVRGRLRGAGLVSVDLDDIGVGLRSLPWVDSAAVQRSWPRGLKIDIIEQTAVARWNEAGLVNARGSYSRARRTSFRQNCHNWQVQPAREGGSYRALSGRRRAGSPKSACASPRSISMRVVPGISRSTTACRCAWAGSRSMRASSASCWWPRSS